MTASPIDYLTTADAQVGDRTRPDRFSSYGTIEAIEGGWMKVRMPDGRLVTTDIGSLPTNRVLLRNASGSEASS